MKRKHYFLKIKTKAIGLALTMLLFTGLSLDGLGQQASTVPKTSHKNQPFAASLDAYIPQLLDSASIPGLSLAVIRDGKIAYVHGYGVKSVETKEKVTPATVFDAASLSKPVFAYAVLKMVDAGLIDLDKPLYQYLPYDDIKRDERYKQITARMALSHSSGFPNWRGGDSLRIHFQPGQRFSYSGEGFVYLQKVVEKITGKPLNEVMQEKVFKPLRMNNSSYTWQKNLEQNFAIPHDGLANIKEKNKPEKANAAYSLQTTAPDYATFILAILNETGLQKKSVSEMLNAQIPVPEELFNPASPASKAVSWGLGLGLQKASDGDAFWHWGDNNVFKCYVVAYKKEKKGVVYFTNSYNGLSIAREIVRNTVGGKQPALDFLSYSSYKAPANLFMRDMTKVGIEEAIKPFLDRDKKSTIKEDDMNGIGYQLLNSGKRQEALQVFKLNKEAYPASANVYDSYAEACLVNGDYEEAAQNYLKSYELNPDNKGAKHIADQLLSSQPLKGNTDFKLAGYPDARLVTVAGSFNNWNGLHTVLHKKGDQWIGSADLSPGNYQYKFVVDGKWILDPANPETIEDTGHKNSKLVVK